MSLEMYNGNFNFNHPTALQRTQSIDMDADNEEKVLVCGICQEILLGREGGPDTLLEHMVTDHGKFLSPEVFTEFTLKVAQETGYPNQCIEAGYPSTDSDSEEELLVCGICQEILLGTPDTLQEHLVTDHEGPLSPGTSTTSNCPRDNSSEDGNDGEESSSESAENPKHQKKYYGPQDGPWCDSDDEEAVRTGVWILTKDGIRIMDRGVFLDKYTAQQILDQDDGDPSHWRWRPVNTLKEKAASIVGCLLTRPEDLGALQIPDVLKKLVGCWNHKIYRHRYPAEDLIMGPRGCNVCCKEKGCRACCEPRKQATEPEPDSDPCLCDSDPCQCD